MTTNDADSAISTATASTPQQLATLFNQRYGAGEMAALADLYDEASIYVEAPGQVTHGRAAIRDALTVLYESGARVTLEVRRCHIVEDIALMSSLGTVTGFGPNGEDVTLSTAELAVRGADGAWRYKADDPFWLV